MKLGTPVRLTVKGGEIALRGEKKTGARDNKTAGKGKAAPARKRKEKDGAPEGKKPPEGG